MPGNWRSRVVIPKSYVMAQPQIQQLLHFLRVVTSPQYQCFHHAPAPNWLRLLWIRMTCHHHNLLQFSIGWWRGRVRSSIGVSLRTVRNTSCIWPSRRSSTFADSGLGTYQPHILILANRFILIQPKPFNKDEQNRRFCWPTIQLILMLGIL